MVRDNRDLMVELLREIRDGVADPEAPTASTGGTDIHQNVIRASATNGFVQPQNFVSVTNEKWDTYDVSPISLDGDLAPGDTETVAQVLSTGQNDLILGLKSVGATSHTADIDGDNRDESVVEYRYEFKLPSGSTWIRHKGLSGTFAHGSMTNPEEVVPGWLVGPVTGVRIRLHNRTDDSSFTDTTVNKDQLGGRITAAAFTPQNDG